MQTVTYQPEHLGLAAHDPVQLADWIVRVLDAKVLFHNGASPPAMLLALAGASWIEVYPADPGEVSKPDNFLAGWRHLALRVVDLDLAREDLHAKGVEFEGEIRPAGGGGRILFFRDPEGNLWHLVERRDSALAGQPLGGGRG